MAADDWDDSIEAAWTAYAEALTEALDRMQTDDTLCLEASFARTPYLQVLKLEDEFLVEVSSNRFNIRHLDEAALARLADLSFQEPTDGMPNHWIPIGDGEFAAGVIVMALRDVLGVVHPSFLSGTPISWVPDQLPMANPRPTGPEHLKSLIDQTLIALTGEEPERDEDGDIPIRTGHSIAYVMPHPTEPVIRMVALVVDDVRDPVAAENAITRLNRKVGGAKFILKGDRIAATFELIASPFVPEHLELALSRFCDIVAEHDLGLAHRCGGHVVVDPPVVDDIHPVMMKLMQLDAERPLSPRLIAKVCRYDSDLIAELITWNCEQEIAWRKARDEAAAADDEQEAEVCEYERIHAERTIKLMRKALRRVLAD